MKLKPEIEKLIQEKLSNCDAGTCSECDERADLARAGFRLGVEKAAEYLDKEHERIKGYSIVARPPACFFAEEIRKLASEHPDAEDDGA